MRKGAIFGVFMGWISLISYIIYSVGFIFGSILMSYETNNTLNISDILVVGDLYYKSIRKRTHNYCPFTGCHHLWTKYAVF